MESLEKRCLSILDEQIGSTRDGDPRLCEFLALASQHSLTAYLKKLLPKVVQLPTSGIQRFHGKIDAKVLALIYAFKAEKMEDYSKSLESVIKNLPCLGGHSLVAVQGKQKRRMRCQMRCGKRGGDRPVDKYCTVCLRFLCHDHALTECCLKRNAYKQLKCPRCSKCYGNGCECSKRSRFSDDFALSKLMGSME